MMLLSLLIVMSLLSPILAASTPGTLSSVILKGAKGVQGIRGPPGIPGPPGQCPSLGSYQCRSQFREILKEGTKGMPPAELVLTILEDRDFTDDDLKTITRGIIGIMGPAGPDVIFGEKGEKGDPGMPGLDGMDGDPGLPGPIGPRGEPGEPGATGEKGMKGDTGMKGERGQKGEPGFVGTVGDPGPSGPPGNFGPPGPPGVTGNRGAKGDRGAAGVTYINWGVSTCPSHANLLYQGTVVQGQATGSSVECLYMKPAPPPTPVSSQPPPPPPPGYYQKAQPTTKMTAFSYTETRTQNVEVLKCAMCYVSERAARFVHLGSSSCPQFWTLEYSGTFASLQGVAKSDSVCMNEKVLKDNSAKSTLNLLEFDMEGPISCALCTK